jgi:hypothetical protein
MQKHNPHSMHTMLMQAHPNIRWKEKKNAFSKTNQAERPSLLQALSNQGQF